MKPDSHVREGCRWHNRGGVTLFGDSPTIYDPRQTGMQDTALIHAHEQMHVDLINNTVFGYVLRRLRELNEIAAEPARSRSGRLQKSLASKIWTCAEGSATALEATIVKSPGATTSDAMLRASLTPDYLEALAAFQPIVDYAIPFSDPINLISRSCIISAVVECAADYHILSGNLAPEEFWALSDCLDEGAIPDETFPQFVAAAAQLPSEIPAALFGRHLQALKDDNLPLFARQLILDLKTVLLTQQGILQASPLLPDEPRIAYIARVDAGLVQAFPQIPQITWTPGYISPMSSVRVEKQEPAFLLESETVAPEGLLDRMSALAQVEGFYRFTVVFFPEVPEPTYGLIAQPVSLLANSLDLAVPYLISRGVQKETAKAIDQSGLPLSWSTPTLRVKGGLFYDTDLLPLLENHVYLELPEFSWPVAAKFAGEFAGDMRLVSYQLPQSVGLTIPAVHKKRVTIFGVAPLSLVPDFQLTQKAERIDLVDNLEMASVALVSLRQSKQQTI